MQQTCSEYQTLTQHEMIRWKYDEMPHKHRKYLAA
jgi:hypothetical protein